MTDDPSAAPDPARRFPRLFLAGALTGAATGLYVYHRHLRPKLRDWGATPEECATPWPGEDRLDAAWCCTTAIDIDAPPTDVWPWLVQMGHRRGGWYAYGRSAPRVLTEHQSLHEGDLIPIDSVREVGLRVQKMDQERMLVLDWEPGPLASGSRSPARGRWSYRLVPKGPHGTRLLLRILGTGPHPWAYTNGPILDQWAPIAQRRHLIGVKSRAERLYRIHRARWRRRGAEVARGA